MYLPASFTETSQDKLNALIGAHPFGTLISRSDDPAAPRSDVDAINIEHIPFLLDTSTQPTTLISHVSRGNSVWRHLDGKQVLTIFHGPTGYVSPNWYPSKRIAGEAVPTWNYAVVHVYGRARIIDNPTELLRIVTRLTDAHEHGQTHPWQVSDAPASFIDKKLTGIVGIEIAIERMIGKFKLGQNRSSDDRAGVIEGLEQRNPTLAAITPR